MVKTHSRLHQPHRTRSYRKPLKILVHINDRRHFHKLPQASMEVVEASTNFYGSRGSFLANFHKFRKLPPAFIKVVKASISFRGSRGTLTTTEASTTSMESSTTCMIASITSMEASIVSIEAPTGFHGSSPKLAGKLLSQGWRPLSWKYSKFSEEIATASEEASVQLPRK